MYIFKRKKFTPPLAEDPAMVRKTKEQALETRNSLLDWAEQVFQEQGVSRTTLADIASRAGLTRGAIYWHFNNKADLIEAMFERVHLPVEAMAEASASDDSTDPLGELRKTVLYVFDQTVNNIHFRRVFDIVFHKCEYVEELGSILERDRRHRAESLARMARILKNAEARGQLPAAIDHQLAAVAFHAYVCGLISDWLFAPDSFDLLADGPWLVDGFLGMLKHAPALRRQTDAEE